MNIYNKLFILEYIKDPKLNKYGYKHWHINLSRNRGHLFHRDFDFPIIIYKNYKSWYRYNRRHRLIGPAKIKKDNEKYYYINNININ